VGKTKRGKGTKLMGVVDSSGLPLAVYAESASPHEVTLVRETLVQSFTRERPVRLIGDRAYDSDPLNEELRAEGIELIAPHRANRKKALTQDGRKLRRANELGVGAGTARVRLHRALNSLRAALEKTGNYKG
jgi:IS5 family transposase